MNALDYREMIAVTASKTLNNFSESIQKKNLKDKLYRFYTSITKDTQVLILCCN